MLALILGGSASGKSEYAEKLAQSLGKKIFYVAAMMPYGETARARIKRHRRLREGKGFELIEKYRAVDEIEVSDTVIIECMSNLLANEMFGEDPKYGRYVVDCIDKIKCDNIIIVSNNVFEDGIKYDVETMRYIENLAYINNELAKRADKVVEVVCGIALEVK